MEVQGGGAPARPVWIMHYCGVSGNASRQIPHSDVLIKLAPRPLGKPDARLLDVTVHPRPTSSVRCTAVLVCNCKIAFKLRH